MNTNDLVWVENVSKQAVMVAGKWLEPTGHRQMDRRAAVKAVERAGGALRIREDAPLNAPANFDVHYLDRVDDRDR